MSGEATIWEPRQLLQVSANSKRVEEKFTAVGGQTVFNLKKFTFTPNTGALAVYRNGLALARGYDWTESPEGDGFILYTPSLAGDSILAVGFTEITGEVAAPVIGQREVQTGADIVLGVTTFSTIAYTLGGNNLFVFRNGVYQSKGIDYNETSETSITWVATPEPTDSLVFINNILNTGTYPEVTTDDVTHQEGVDVYNLQTYLINLNARVSRNYINIYQAAADNTLALNNVIRTGLSIFKVVNTATNLPISGLGLYLQAMGDIWADDFINPATTDAGPGLRIMRDHAESLGRRVVIRSTGRNYLLQTTEVVPGYGGNVGLYITSLKNVRIDFGGGTILFDKDLPALGALAKDAVLALAPPNDGSDNYAFANIKNINLDGGQWATKAERPNNVLKANYRVIAYCMFEDMQLSRAYQDVWVSDGFVMIMTKIRARFAGESNAGFRLETTSAAKTGYKISGCTVDYAGNYGFNITGASGHTYCHIDNCHVDFVGRDDDGSQIVSTLATVKAYNIRDIRVFNITAAGSEFCTSILGMHNCRSISVNGLFSVGAGHLDGVTEIDNLIKCTGYFEQVNIQNFENRSPKAGGFNCWLAIENAAAYNINTIQIDTSIKESDIRFDGGNSSSTNLPLVITPEHNYKGNYRRGAGDIVKTGKPKLGFLASAPYGPEDVLEQTFYIDTGASPVSQDLINVTQRTDGYTTFFFEILVCRQTVTAPSKYEGAITVHPAAHAIVAPTATEIGGSGTAPSITFVADVIGITCPNTYAGYFIKVTAVQRAGANYTRFNWI